MPHRRRRPPWGRIIAATAALVLLLVVMVGVGGAFWYYKSVDAGLRRTDAFGRGHDARAAKATGGAQNILLLGSDSRDADDPGHTPEPGDAHTDTIVLMHVDAAHEKAYLVSIPRDLYVYVPRSPIHSEFGDTTTKINAAFAWGGLPLAVQTIEGYTGVRIDHVVMVDFEGFRLMVTAGQPASARHVPVDEAWTAGILAQLGR